MSDIANPYVGPRTFQENERDRFFGREREARELFALTVSEQLVLFYAQSGAGKSSLVNTCLIPDLRAKGFEVFMGRVAGDALPQIKVENIYVFNLIHSLASSDMSLEKINELTLSQYIVTLRDSLPAVASSTGEEQGFKPHALIIDQFEELFSTHPEAWEKREIFFSQLSQAMEDDPYLWVILVMREDFIAALDPYAHLLPGGLRRRYYMQRLEREAAIKAVKIPAEKFRRPYERGVAEKLVNDLSRIKVQKPDGSLGFETGQFIEPVQLQVVCFSLWKNLPPGNSITENDLLKVGDVDEALGNYFAERIRGVAETKHVKERFIREWIGTKLIAAGGIRGMVLRESNRNHGGISDEVIQALQSDLVRAENRGGTIWYELTHDRLVGPILENNKEWFNANLSPLQRQAALWNDEKQKDSWLLSGQALSEVEQWAETHPDELTEIDTRFLEACHAIEAETKEKQEREAQRKELESARKLMEEQARTAEAERKELETTKKLADEQARSARSLRRFLALVGVLGLIAVFAAVAAAIFGARAQAANAAANDNLIIASTEKANAQAASTLAVGQQREANNANATAQAASTKAVEQADKALSGNLSAQADSLKNVDYPLALLLGIEAYERDPNLLTRTTLFELLQFTPYKREFGFNGVVSSVAVSPDGTIIAAASCTGDNCKRGEIFLFDADLNPIGKLPGGYGIVYSLGFHQHPDSPLVLAAGGCVPDGCSVSRGQITFWDLSDPKNPARLSDTTKAPKPAHGGLVKTIAFSPDGTILASGSYDTSIILWDIRDLENPRPAGKPLIEHTSFVNSLVFGPDSNLLVSGSDDTTIRLWNVANPAEASLVRTKLTAQHKASVNSITFSPDGKRFASVSNDGKVFLWDWDGTQRPPLTNAKILTGHTGYVKSVAFNHDGMILASTGFDSRIILWDTSTGEQVGPALSVHSRAVNGIFFGVKSQGDSQLPYLISGGNDRAMIKWDLSARQPLSRTFQVESPPSLAEGEDGLTSSNGEYCAEGNGQQIDITLLVDSNGGSCASASDPQSGLTRAEGVFLTLAGFDSPVQYIEFEGPDSLGTQDQHQFGTSWMTRWNIDPDSWLQRACEAVKQSLTEPARLDVLDRFLQKLHLPPAEQPQETCISGQN
jgi:WD40 repeat protein